jgi:hypothetical protein
VTARVARKGSVLLVVVLLVALLAATVTGHLQVNAEEIRLMRNHLHGAEALALAEAALNEALAVMRQDPGWSAGFRDRVFDGGTYSVFVDGSHIRCSATTAAGYVATLVAEVTIAPDGPPHTITIDSLRLNE